MLRFDIRSIDNVKSSLAFVGLNHIQRLRGILTHILFVALTIQICIKICILNVERIVLSQMIYLMINALVNRP